MDNFYKNFEIIIKNYPAYATGIIFILYQLLKYSKIIIIELKKKIKLIFREKCKGYGALKR